VKTRPTLALLVALLFCRSLLAGDTANPSRASTLLQEKTAAAGSCCAEKSTSKPAACCPAKPDPAPKACCAAAGKIENPDSTAGNFTKNSLYQAEAAFTTDTGRAFTLGELRGRPVVLTMFFASCGYACPLIVTDMQAIRAQLPAEARDRARFVLVSFDVARDTPAVLAQYRAQRGLDEQWVLLHGTDDAVRELAALLGVKYRQEADGSFSHSNLITILNPQGEIVHQRTGLTGGLPETAAALAAATP
jgi:protein SCO1/2